MDSVALFDLCFRCALVFRKLHRNQDDRAVLLPGEPLDIGTKRLHPARSIRPAAYGDTDPFLRRVHMIPCEDFLPFLQRNRIKRKYSVRCRINGAMYPESLKKSLRLTVTHRDGIHMV